MKNPPPVESNPTSYETELSQLNQSFNRQIASLKSRTRGLLGEILSATIIPRSVRDDTLFDKTVLDTPFGQRRIDNYLPDQRKAIESKYTKICASARIRKQIEKDAYLLKQGTLSSITWVLYYGGSKRALHLLRDHGIEVIESWDAFKKETEVNG